MEQRFGIGSFAYRYQVGTAAFCPSQPMDAFAFADDALSMQLHRIQLCENLKYAGYSRETLERLADYLREKNIAVELGMYGATYENLKRHVELAKLFGASFLRLAVGEKKDGVDTDPKVLAATLNRVLAEDEGNIEIGIENHFDLTTDEIISVVESAKNPRLGVVYDTTNAIHLMERPEETLEKMAPYLKSVHLKDFKMDKTEASITMNGRVWGEGSLDTLGLLQTIERTHPEATIIMELSICRDVEADEQTVLRTEREQIQKSVKNIRAQLESIKNIRKEQVDADV